MKNEGYINKHAPSAYKERDKERRRVDMDNKCHKIVICYGGRG